MPHNSPSHALQSRAVLLDPLHPWELGGDIPRVIHGVCSEQGLEPGLLIPSRVPKPLGHPSTLFLVSLRFSRPVLPQPVTLPKAAMHGYPLLRDPQAHGAGDGPRAAVSWIKFKLRSPRLFPARCQAAAACKVHFRASEGHACHRARRGPSCQVQPARGVWVGHGAHVPCACFCPGMRTRKSHWAPQRTAQENTHEPTASSQGFCALQKSR